MQPEIQVNWLAVLASIGASFVVGFLWHGPLFGKVWVRAMGLQDAPRPPTRVMVRAMLLSLAGAFLMAYVLAHTVDVWRPSTWLAGQDGAPAMYGFMAGFFVWLGYVLPLLLNQAAFEQRSWTLFGLSAGYYFVVLQAMGMILAFWR